jgi:hypothetical protein
MQAANARYLVLTLVLAVGAALYSVVREASGGDTALRWPEHDATYAAAAWSAGPLNAVPTGNETMLVTRAFRNLAGVSANLSLLTRVTPKLYAAGAEVPLLGNGYTVEPAPADLVPTGQDGIGALVARHGTEQWVVLYAYGERRGLLGNGPRAWTLAVVDGLLGRPNDYYKLYLMARADQGHGQVARDVAQLAHDLFPRIAAWYAAI